MKLIARRVSKRFDGQVLISRAVVSVVTCSLLAGCITNQSLFNEFSGYNDNSDRCNVYRQPLIEAGESVYSDAIIHSLIAGAGAFITAKIADADTDDAIAIGVAGAFAGGFFSVAIRESELNEQQAKFVTQLKSEAAASGRVKGVISQLADCRAQELKSIKADVNAGRIQKPEAQLRVGELRDRVKKDNELIAEVLGEANNRLDNYVKVAADEGISEQELLGQRAATSAALPDLEIRGVAHSVKGSNVRVRAGASTRSRVLGVVSTPQKIGVTGDSPDGEWKQVWFSNRAGYIAKQFLKPTSASVSAPAPAPQPTPTAGSGNVAQGEHVVAVQDLAANTQEAENIQQQEQAKLDNEMDDLLAVLDV